MPDPERPYIVTKGVDLLKKVAETNGIKADPEEYLKRSNGNYSDAMDIMLDENGYEPYDEATKKQIHDKEQLPILSSDYILKNRLSDAEQKDLETKSNEIFDKLQKGYGTETFGYEKVQNFKYDEKDKVRLKAELNTINERLRRDSDLRDLLPNVIKPEENVLGQKSYKKLKNEANKEIDSFTPAPGLSYRDYSPADQKLLLEDQKKEKAQKNLQEKIELDKEYLADPIVITANTAAVTAKALGNKEKEGLYASKKILNDQAAKLNRQYDMALEKFQAEPTEENGARVDYIGAHIDAQAKEIAKGDKIANAVSIYARKKAKEVEAKAEVQGTIANIGTYLGNVGLSVRDRIANGLDDIISGKDDTLEEHQAKNLERGIAEADRMQQSRLRGGFRERYVEVDGQKLVVDNDGEVLYGVDDKFRPTDKDISKFIAKYEVNPDAYEQKADYSPTRLIGTSIQVMADMVPIIAANAAIGVASAALPGGQAKTLQALGSIGASAVTMFSDNLKRNLELGKGYNYAWNTAMGTTLVQALIEQAGGLEARAGRALGETAKTAMRTKLDDLVQSYAGRSLAKTDLVKKAKGVIKEYIGEGFEESGQDITAQVSDHMFYGVDVNIDWNDQFNTWASLPLGVGGVKAIVGHLQNKADRDMMRRGYNAAQSSTSGFNEVLDSQVADKSITEKEASIKKEVLSESKADYDAINDNYDHITKEGKNRLVSLMADRDMNRMMAKYIEIGPGKETYAKKAEELDKKFRDLWKELDEKGRKDKESGHGDVRGINFDVETIKDEDNERQESGDVNGDTQGTGTGEEVKAEGENKGTESQAGGTDKPDSGGNAEGAVSVLTKEAEDILSDPTKVPVFISKNLERIAKENGIEITGSMTGADVINALKQKRDGKATNEPSGVQREATTEDGAGQPGASDVDPAGTKQEAVQETVPSGNKMSVLESTARKIILNQELTVEEKQERANNPTEVDRWVKVNRPYLELSDRIDRLSDNIEDIKFRTNYDPSISYQDSEGNQGTITIDNGGKAEFVYKGGVKELGNISGGISENMRRAGIVAKGKVQPLGGGQYSIDGVFYKNNLSDPARAINIDKEGNVVSVDLDEVQGGYNNIQPVTKSKTFTGPQAEELAYQIHLEKISKDEKRFIQYVRERGDGSVPTETQEGAVENNDGLSKGEDKQGEADKQAAKGEVRPEEQEVKRTLSGLTEEERLAAVEARKKETKFSDTEKGMQEFWSLVDRYEGLIEGARGKSSTSGQQLWGDILQKSKPLKIEVTRTKGGGVTKVVAKKGGKRLKNVKSYKEGNYKAISPNEDKALLDNRSGKVQDIFSKLYHNLESPGIQIEYGVKLSDVQKEQAFNDVADGIPSNGAEAVLDVVEKFVRDGNIVLYDESMGEMAISIEEFFGNEDLEWLSQQGVSKEDLERGKESFDRDMAESIEEELPKEADEEVADYKKNDQSLSTNTPSKPEVKESVGVGGDIQEDIVAKGSTKNTKRKIRDEVLRAEAAEAFNAFKKSLGKNLSSGGLDPDSLEKGIKLIGVYIKAGVYKFSDIVEDAVEEFGDVVKEIFDELKVAYTAYYGTSTDDEAQQMDVVGARKSKFEDIIKSKTNEKQNGRSDSEGLDRLPTELRGGLLQGAKEEGSAGEPIDEGSGSLPQQSEGIKAKGKLSTGRRRGGGKNVPISKSVSVIPDLFGQQPEEERLSSEQPALVDEPPLIVGTILPNPAPLSNYVPEEKEEDTAKSFSKTRHFKKNLEAIRTLLAIVKDGDRLATSDEKKILFDYVGWGGIKAVNRIPGSTYWSKSDLPFKSMYEELLGLVSEFEQIGYSGLMGDISRSTQNAHYTTGDVIRGVYYALNKLGFTGGSILEPSAGIGNFIGYAPNSVLENSSITAIELDKFTGKILEKLYPSVYTKIKGYQEVKIPNDSIDLVISNIPFGNYNVTPNKRDSDIAKRASKRIHNYFFVKAIEQAREGGLVAFVTSTGVLDSPGNEFVRDFINENAEFIGAIRLPNTTFKVNAGTEVVTDILFLKKKKGSSNQDIVGISKIAVPGGNVTINNYFIKNPSNVIGEVKLDFGLNGNELVVEYDGNDIEDRIKDIVDKSFPSNIYRKTEVPNNTEEVIDEKEVDNRIYIDNNGVFIYSNNERTLIDVGKEKASVFIELRDVLDRQYKLESNPNVTDNVVEGNRAQLNKIYDTFVGVFGLLNSPKNAKFILNDRFGYNVLALEKNGAKADIFAKRSIASTRRPNKVSNIEDAISISYNETGVVDLDIISSLLGVSRDTIVEDNYGSLFYDSDWNVVSKEEYLSGNVKKKYKEALALAENNEIYQQNVDALSAVLPKDIPIEEIEINIGQRWVPLSYYQDFANFLFKTKTNIKYDPITDTYALSGNKTGEATGSWAVGNMDGFELFIHAIHGSSPAIYMAGPTPGSRVIDPVNTQLANEKTEKISEEFKSWIVNSPERAEVLQGIYNDAFNTNVKRVFSDFFTANGMSSEIVLAKHQKRGANMIVSNNGGIIDHMVGAGKTFLMISAAIKMRQLGVASKPMIVGLKSTIQDLASDAKKLFPMAKILSPSEGDFSKENRKKLLATIQNNDWDLILITHEQFGAIPQDKEFHSGIIAKEIEEIELALAALEAETGEAASRKLIQGLTNRKENLSAKLSELADFKKDEELLSFKEIGIDHLFVDESQFFKNLAYTTRINRVSGLGNPIGSKRSYNMLIAARTLQALHGGDKGLTFVSGTPISNSLVEMYLLLKYLRPKRMQELGYTTFDSWVNQFAIKNRELEFTVAGNIKEKTRFREFVNVPELSLLYNEVADVRNEYNLTIKRPKIRGGKPILVAVKQSDAQQEWTNRIIEFAQQTHGSRDGTLIGKGVLSKSEQSAAMLMVTTIGNKLSNDIRLVDKNAEFNPDGKLVAVADTVVQEYKNSNHIKGTQLIFSDIGTPKTGKIFDDVMSYLEDEKNIDVDTINLIFGEPNEETGVRASKPIKQIRERIKEYLSYSDTEIDYIFEEAKNSSLNSFNTYSEIKRLLVQKGIPSDEIVFIHDYRNKNKRKSLFADVNKGKVRVVIGSTQKLGTGVNVQERIVAMHHVDAKWTPADMEQRNGRGIRQGNINEEVAIYQYGTEQTLDAYKYQLIATKQRFIDQVKMGALSGTRIIKEDEGENMSAQEFVAILSGNPLLLEKAKLESLVSKLTRSSKVFIAEQSRIKLGIVNSEKAIIRYQEFIEKRKKDIETASKNMRTDESGKSVPIWVIDYKQVDDPKTRRELLEEKLQSIKGKGIGDSVLIGQVGGINYIARNVAETTTGKPKIEGQLDFSEIKYELEGEMVYGTSSVPSNTIMSFQENLEKTERVLQDTKKELESYINSVKTVWPKENELKEAKERLDVVIKELSVDDKEVKKASDDPSFMINNGEVQNARRALDNATKRLRDAEKRMAEVNGVQASAFNAPQGYLFGTRGEDIKVVIDPLKRAVKEAKEAYDKAVARAEAEENAKNGQQSLFQKEKRKLEPIDTVLFNKLLKNLNKAIPGVFGGVLEKKAFEEKLKEMHGISMRDKKGIIYGFVGHDGKVYLNGDVINANTPIHEYGHIFINIMKDKFPQVYRRGLNLADKSPYLSTLLSQGKKSDYAPLIDRYKNADKTALQEEALAMAIGDMGERMVQRNMKNAFLEWVDKMWTAIKRVFGGRLTDMTLEQLNRLTFKQFSNLVAGQLLVLAGDPVAEAKESVNNIKDPQFQIVGEKGAGQLDNAPNIVQAAKRLDNLEVAKNMESKGADARTIFLATGWQKGGDGKWKTEIGDITFNNLFEGDNPIAMQIEDNGFVKLGELVSGEVLDAYPYLKDVPVKFVKGTPGNGQYDGNEIRLQYKSEMDFIINEQVLLKALAHEVQHYVQDQEGFAKGTTSDYFTEDKLNYMTQLVYEDFLFRNLEYDEYIKQHGNAAESVLEPLDEWEDFQKEAKKGKDNVTKILADAKRHSLSKYRKVAGEVEANNVMKRMDMPLSERLVKTFTDTEDVAEDEKIYLFDSKISNSTFDLNKYKAEKRRERAEDNVNRAKANLFNAWNNLKTVGVVSDPWQNSQNMKRVIDAAIELAIQVGAKTKEEIKAALNDVIKKHNLSPNQLNNIARAVKAYSEPFDQDIFNDLVQNTDSAHEAFGFLRLMRQNTKDPIKYGKVLKLEDELTKRQIEYEESQQVPEGTENNTKAEILKSFGEALTSYKMPLSQPKDVAITGAYNPLVDNEVFGTTMQASMLHAKGFVQNWFDLFKARDISTKAFFQEVADYLAANPGSIYSETIANASYRLLAELKRGYKNDKYWDSIYDIMNIPAQAQRRSNLGIALALGSQENSGHAFSGKLEAIEQFKAGLNENLTDEELDENNHEEIKRLGAEIHEEEANRRPIPPPGYLQRKARRAYKEVEQSVINRVKEKIKGCK